MTRKVKLSKNSVNWKNSRYPVKSRGSSYKIYLRAVWRGTGDKEIVAACVLGGISIRLGREVKPYFALQPVLTGPDALDWPRQN